MKLYTIGFTKKSAETFFGLLKQHSITHLVDIRLNPTGQLAGFAKQYDLAYFLRALIGCNYTHLEALAPTPNILSQYRQDKDWVRYVNGFEALMQQRDIPQALDRQLFEANRACLLCSEATPEQCHRRLVAERLQAHWAPLEIIHLV